MDLRDRIGTTAINLFNIAALVTFLINEKDYLLGITAGVFCIAGQYIGLVWWQRAGQKVVRSPVVLVVLLCL